VIDDFGGATRSLTGTAAVERTPGLGEGDWWLQYGLDGIIGALFAALLAGYAVRRTLRHERRQADLAALREVVAVLQARSFELSTRLELGHGEMEELFDAVVSLRSTALTAQGLSAKRWRGLSLWIEACDVVMDIAAVSDPLDAELERSLTNLRAVCSSWLAEPTSFDPRWWQFKRRSEVRKNPPSTTGQPPLDKALRG
jgi:hypothetical protein